MTESLNLAKATLRQQVRSRLAAMTTTQREAGSRAICSRLPQQKVWSSAGAILFFAPIQHEPDVWPLLQQALAESKPVALPFFNAALGQYEARQIRDPAADLLTGQYGIREPKPGCPLVPLNRLDLVLVPGVVFDPQGRRLGRGQGYYDRLLAQAGGITCGIAFDEQLVDAVPVGPHDITLNCILTPTRWIET